MGYLDGQLESRCETSGTDGRRTVRINEISGDVNIGVSRSLSWAASMVLLRSRNVLTFAT